MARTGIPAISRRTALLSAASLPFGGFAAASEQVAGLPDIGRDLTARLGGLDLRYRVEIRSTPVADAAGAPIADMVATSYLARSRADPATRPVIFFFPGGPGSAASGLVLGGFAPVVVDYPLDPVRPASARMIANPGSLLDIADLVFVDMPGVGFSRLAAGVPGTSVEGVRQDAALHAAFVLSWLAANGRAKSPVLLAGKSYGALRVSHTALQLARTAPGLDLRGLVLLCGAWDIAAMDFAGNFTPSGDLSAYWAYAPTYAAIAWRYGLAGRGSSLEAHVEAARAFAVDRLAPALLRGQGLAEAERRDVANGLSALIGLSPDLIAANQLRISSDLFRRSLVSGRVLGLDNATFAKEDDPHEFGGDKALEEAWEAYLTELRVPAPTSYKRATLEPAGRWDWHAASDWRLGYPRVSDALLPLFKAKGRLRLFAAVGYYDLATPFFAAETMSRRPGLPSEAITFGRYPSGHSVWIHPPSRQRLQADLRSWLKARVLKGGPQAG